MKKFYFLLMALMVAMTASADWCLRGDFNGWGTDNKFVADGTKFVLKNVKIGAKTNLKVDDGSGGTSYGEWDGIAKNMTAGNSYKCHKGGGNMTMGDAEFTGDVYFWIDGNDGWAYIQFVAGGSTPDPTDPTGPTYTYFLHGNFTGSWASTEMTEADGALTVSGIKVTNADAKFGVKKMEGANQKAWYAASADVTISATTTITLTDSNTQDIKIAMGTYDFSFNPESKELTVTKQAGTQTDPVEKEYTVYYNNGKTAWDEVYAYVYDANNNNVATWPGEKMTKVEPVSPTDSQTTWSYTFTTTLTPATVIFNSGLKSGSSVEAGTQTENLAFVDKKTYGEPAPAYVYLILSSENDQLAFGAAGEDGIVEFVADVEFEEWAAGTEFCVVRYDMNNPADVTYYTAEAEVANCSYGLNGWVNVAASNEMPETFLTLAASATGKEVTFKFNPATLYIGADWTPTVEVAGKWANDWALPNTMYKASEIDENSGVEITLFKYQNGEGSDAGFKFVIDGVWYGVEADNVNLGAWTGVKKDGNNIVLNGVNGMDVKVNLYLDTLTFNALQLTTGVEAIAADANVATEYFNLQGVRVANPENGLYIVRRGNTVSKIVK